MILSTFYLITVEMSWRRPVDAKDDGMKEESTRWKRRDAREGQDNKWRRDDDKPKKDTIERWRKDDYDKDDTRDRIDKDRGMDGRPVSIK